MGPPGGEEGEQLGTKRGRSREPGRGMDKPQAGGQEGAVQRQGGNACSAICTDQRHGEGARKIAPGGGCGGTIGSIYLERGARDNSRRARAHALLDMDNSTAGARPRPILLGGGNSIARVLLGGVTVSPARAILLPR